MIEKQHPNRTLDRRSLLILIAGLVLAAILLTAWRVVLDEADTLAPGDHTWDIELNVAAEATDGQTRIAAATPYGNRFVRTVSRNIDHQGWRPLPPVGEQGRPNRRINLLASQSGHLTAQITFTVYQSATPMLSAETAGRADSEPHEAYLRDHPLLEIDHAEVKSLSGHLAAGGESRTTALDAIFDFVTNLGNQQDGSLRPVSEILITEKANRRERAYTMVALCRAAGIPARLVKGLILRDSGPTALHFWVEAYDDGKWVPFDPALQHRRSLPPNYLAFAKGLRDVVEVAGAGDYSVDYAVTSSDLLMDVPDPAGEDWRSVFDLDRLPLETRLVLSGLMLLPFAVWVTAVFGQLIGLRFYGVFTPALLAMSLAYVPPRAAATILAVVLILGVIGRSGMPQGLSRIIRLSIVLTLVAMSVALSTSLMAHLGLAFGDQLVLLPIVILASLVDRFYTVLDEKGLHDAMLRLGWTLAIAVLCMPVFELDALGHLMIRYPELHLITLAAMLALSLYRGKRLLEIPGFSWLAIDEKPKQKA